MEMRFVLGSASPARKALLDAAGIKADVVVSGVDESQVATDDAYALCLELARLKAQAVASELDSGPELLVLGCDSVLAFDGQIWGKPRDADEAKARWRAMRGRSGVLHTGHHLIRPGTGESAEEVGTTTVHFADITDAEIDAYVGTGEPLLVAGSFTIDGRGGAFVERLEGDHGNVIGLSLPILRRLLGRVDVAITDLWR